MAERLLLDTCAVIWIAQDAWIQPAAREAIGASAFNSNIAVSVMTAWELGMLGSKGRFDFDRHPTQWFDDFVQISRVMVQTVTPAILVASSYLPGPIHADPVDRILIATAREHDLVLVSRDRAILRYGAAGHVRTLAC